MSSGDLRKALEWITENTMFAMTETLQIEKIRVNSGHTIQVLPSERALESYNCVKYALETACRIDGLPDVKTSLIQRLIDSGTMIEQSEPGADLLCVYLFEDTVKHIGWMVGSTRVQSKWGTRQLYEHGVWEVPASYGSSVRFYSAPSFSDIEINVAALGSSWET